MAERILLPVDDLSRSNATVEHALSVYPNASFVLLHVVDPRDWISTDEYGEVYFTEETKDAVVEEADDLLAAARERVAAADRPVETVRVFGQPAKEIVAYARENDVEPSSWVATDGRGSTGFSSAASRRRWSAVRPCR